MTAPDTMRDVVEEARRQLEYLDERFPTGTTPAVIARIDAALATQPATSQEGKARDLSTAKGRWDYYRSADSVKTAEVAATPTTSPAASQYGKRVECGACRGSGVVNLGKCWLCGGTGLSITIAETSPLPPLNKRFTFTGQAKGITVADCFKQPEEPERRDPGEVVTYAIDRHAFIVRPYTRKPSLTCSEKALIALFAIVGAVFAWFEVLS